MVEFKNFYIFILSSFLLSLSPGPDNIFVLIQTINFGKKAGFLIVFGLMTGLFVHTIFAGLGVSTIIKNSLFLFNLVKIFGIFYLLFLAFNIYKSKKINLETDKKKKSNF
jgi:threonine/homoserine/homoserine lactone efflux protein